MKRLAFGLLLMAAPFPPLWQTLRTVKSGKTCGTAKSEEKKTNAMVSARRFD